MPNQLNSILIEGAAVSIGELAGDAQDGGIAFFIESKKTNRSAVVEAYQFEVHAVGPIASVIADRFKIGQGVRVVGSLRQSQDGHRDRVYIMADHVEFKPVFGSMAIKP